MKNDGPAPGNSTFNLTFQVLPNALLPTDVCFYIDFANQQIPTWVTDATVQAQPKCLLIGPSQEECRYLFPEARLECNTPTFVLPTSGLVTFQQAYFQVTRFTPKFYARNRVSSSANGMLYLIRIIKSSPKFL